MPELQPRSILSDQLDGRDRPHTAIDALRLKTLPNTDLDFALFIPNPCRIALKVRLDRARPTPRRAIASSRTTASAAVARLHRRRKQAIAVGALLAYPSHLKTWLRRTLETVRADCEAFVDGQAAGAS